MKFCDPRKNISIREEIEDNIQQLTQNKYGNLILVRLLKVTGYSERTKLINKIELFDNILNDFENGNKVIAMFQSMKKAFTWLETQPFHIKPDLKEKNEEKSQKRKRQKNQDSDQNFEHLESLRRSKRQKLTQDERTQNSDQTFEHLESLRRSKRKKSDQKEKHEEKKERRKRQKLTQDDGTQNLRRSKRQKQNSEQPLKRRALRFPVSSVGD